MMISPNCPEHGRLVLDLALGRLDDDAAARAEAVSESCPVCRAWWQEQFNGEETALVDEAVASVFGDLELPERRRGHGRMALAAAMIMALGATTLWLAQNPAVQSSVTQSPDSADPVVVERLAAIQSMDFETPSAILAHAERTDGAATAIEAPASVPAEKTDLVSEEIVVAESAPIEMPMPRDSEPLFSGSFESGDLSDWVPTT